MLGRFVRGRGGALAPAGDVSEKDTMATPVEESAAKRIGRAARSRGATVPKRVAADESTGALPFMSC